MTSARKPSTRPVLCTLFALIALFGLGLFDPDRAAASCGEATCNGKQSCKQDNNIGNNCPTGPGSFCVITCNGEQSCEQAKFKPASESGRIICIGTQACKQSRIQLQGCAITETWKRTCTGEQSCEQMNTGGVGTCSGGNSPTSCAEVSQ